MSDPQRPSLPADAATVHLYLSYARIAAWTTISTGALGLGLWLLQAPLLLRGSGLLQPMHALTTLGFMLAGGILLAAQSASRRAQFTCLALASALLILALANLADLFGALELRLDRWSLATGELRLDSRMPAMTAVALLMVSLRGFACCRGCRDSFGDLLSAAVLGIGMLALGAIGIESARGTSSIFSPATPIAAALIFANGLAWAASRPQSPLCSVATARGLGGRFARRLLLPSLLLPLVYAWVLQWAHYHLGEDDAAIIAVLAFATGAGAALAVWRVALLTERLEHQQLALRDLNAMATTDALTGLPNRRAFDQVLVRLLQGRREQDRRFSLLMLDLDHFKRYNDDFGHLAGDEVLRRVGELLRRGLRPDDFAARYGGEEFAVLLGESAGDGAPHTAERLRQSFCEAEWPQRPVTVSIGIARAERLDSAASLIARADAALYAAKRAGRNRVAMGADESLAQAGTHQGELLQSS